MSGVESVMSAQVSNNAALGVSHVVGSKLQSFFTGLLTTVLILLVSAVGAFLFMGAAHLLGLLFEWIMHTVELLLKFWYIVLGVIGLLIITAPRN